LRRGGDAGQSLDELSSLGSVSRSLDLRKPPGPSPNYNYNHGPDAAEGGSRNRRLTMASHRAGTATQLLRYCQVRLPSRTGSWAV